MDLTKARMHINRLKAEEKLPLDQRSKKVKSEARAFILTSFRDLMKEWDAEVIEEFLHTMAEDQDAQVQAGTAIDYGDTVRQPS